MPVFRLPSILRAACPARSAALALLGLALVGCGTASSLRTPSARPINVLKIDLTKEPELVKAGGARWVLFNLDLGARTGHMIRSAASVGQAVGDSVSRLSPEEEIMALFQASRDAARLDQVRGALTAAAPSIPRAFTR